MQSKRNNKYNKEEKIDSENSIYLEKINSEISYNKDIITDIKNNDILMNNFDENNIMIYSNNNLMDNNTNKNTNLSENYYSNINKLFDERKVENILNQKNKNQNEKIDIKTDDKLSIRSLSSDKININIKNKYEIEKEKNSNHRFMSLDTSQSISFSINSSYNNINKISKFKYIKNSELRKKTEEFISDQINDEEKDDISNKSCIRLNKNLLNINFNKKFSPSKTMRKRSENLDSKIHLSKTDDFSSSNINPTKKSLLKHSKVKFDSHIHSSKKFDVHFSPDVDINKKDTKKFHSSIHSDKRNSFKKKQTKKHDDSSEKTFYNKIKTFKKRNAIDFSSARSDGEEFNNKVNFDQLISNNILKNQQNLNNPQEYFEGFFNDIIFKKNKNKSRLDDEDNIKNKKTFRK